MAYNWGEIKPPGYGGADGVIPAMQPVWYGDQLARPAPAPATVTWTSPAQVPQKLTDEQVWLQAYCAKIAAGSLWTTAEKAAEHALKAFRKKFPLF